MSGEGNGKPQATTGFTTKASACRGSRSSLSPLHKSAAPGSENGRRCSSAPGLAPEPWNRSGLLRVADLPLIDDVAPFALDERFGEAVFLNR